MLKSRISRSSYQIGWHVKTMNVGRELWDPKDIVWSRNFKLWALFTANLNMEKRFISLFFVLGIASAIRPCDGEPWSTKPWCDYNRDLNGNCWVIKLTVQIVLVVWSRNWHWMRKSSWWEMKQLELSDFTFLPINGGLRRCMVLPNRLEWHLMKRHRNP